MKIFDLFRRKKKQSASNQFDIDAEKEKMLQDFTKHDYLGKAAEAKHKAKKAVKEKDFDTAWGLLHEEKQLYLQHGERCNFTQAETIALDGCVSEEFANILRLEGNHDQALAHILYWIMSRAEDRVIKRQEQKLRAYCNRCKFDGVDLEDVQYYIGTARHTPDIRNIQCQVSEWRYRSAATLARGKQP